MLAGRVHLAVLLYLIHLHLQGQEGMFRRAGGGQIRRVLVDQSFVLSCRFENGRRVVGLEYCLFNTFSYPSTLAATATKIEENILKSGAIYSGRALLSLLKINKSWWYNS